MTRMPNESRYEYKQRMKRERAKRIVRVAEDEPVFPRLEFVDAGMPDEKVIERRLYVWAFQHRCDLIELPSGKVVKPLSIPDVGQPGSWVEGGMITPDLGTIIARGSSGRVMAWDVNSGALLWCKAAPGAGDNTTLPGKTGQGRGGVTCLAVSPDGRMVASAGSGTVIEVRDVQTGGEVATIDLLRLNEPLLYDETEDGVHFVVRGDPYPFPFFQRHEPRTLDILRTTHDVLSMAFSPDGKVLAAGMCVQQGSGLRARPLLVVDVGTWRARPATWFLPNLKPGTLPRAQIQQYYDTTSVDFSPDGRWCVTAALEGARLYEVRHGAGTEASVADVVAANVGRPKDADDPRRMWWPENAADMANAGWEQRGFVGYSEDDFPTGFEFNTHDAAFVPVPSLPAGEHCILILHEHCILEGRRIGNDGIIDSDVDKPWFIYTQNYFGKRMRLSPDRRWLVIGMPGKFKLAEIATLASRATHSGPTSPPSRTRTVDPTRPQMKGDIPETRPNPTKKQWEPIDLDELAKEPRQDEKEK
jgi:WD40 repeat protein